MFILHFASLLDVLFLQCGLQKYTFQFVSFRIETCKKALKLISLCDLQQTKQKNYAGIFLTHVFLLKQPSNCPRPGESKKAFIVKFHIFCYTKAPTQVVKSSRDFALNFENVKTFRKKFANFFLSEKHTDIFYCEKLGSKQSFWCLKSTKGARLQFEIRNNSFSGEFSSHRVDRFERMF